MRSCAGPNPTRPSAPGPRRRLTTAMQHLRITSPAQLTGQVIAVFANDPAVSQLAVMRGASLKPAGDIVLADVAREATNELIDRLDDLGVPELHDGHHGRPLYARHAGYRPCRGGRHRGLHPGSDRAHS